MNNRLHFQAIVFCCVLHLYFAPYLQAQEGKLVEKPTGDDEATNTVEAKVSDSDFKSEIEEFLRDQKDVRSKVEKASQKASLSESAADSKSKKTKFLRMQTRENGEPKSLDTAVVTYRAPGVGGVTVELIGAVHIGEASYYSALNKKFDEYEVLLYELVAPEGTTIPKGGKREAQGFNPVAMLQDASKDMLGLESQLEHIDYTKRHFVRADMTPTQIANKMAERGDTAITLALDTLADVMRQQNMAAKNPQANNLYGVDPNISLGDLFGNPLKMKRLMAAQFAATGSLDQAMGKSLNQLLIVDRNAEALKGLQRQIAQGKKHIGIFYGAAHLEDFEKHLVEDFGMVKQEQAWLKAWDLTTSKKPDTSEPMGLLMNVLKMLD